MNAIHATVCVSVGLIVALWWAVLPPRLAPAPLPRIETQKQQCPIGSRLEGKVCVCPTGTSWTGTSCTLLSSAEQAEQMRFI